MCHPNIHGRIGRPCNAKFVAAEPDDRGTLAKRTAQPTRDARKAVVAGGIAATVVPFAQLVDVQQQEAPGAGAHRPSSTAKLAPPAPVEEPGELVVPDRILVRVRRAWGTTAAADVQCERRRDLGGIPWHGCVHSDSVAILR